MNNSILYTLITILFIAPFVYLSRKSIGFVFLISLSLFVVSLPFVRSLAVDNASSRSDDNVLFASLAMFIFSLGVFIVSFVIRKLEALSPNYILSSNYAGVDRKILNFTLLVFLSIWILRIYRANTYGILFSGTANEDTIANQDYIFVILYSLIEMMTLGSFYYLCIQFKNINWLFSIPIFTEVIWSLITGGRRNFIFMAGLFAFSLFILNKKYRQRIIVGAAISAMLLFNIVTPFFLNSRVNILNRSVTESAFDATINGIEDSLSSFSKGEVSPIEIVKDNLTERGDAGIFIGSIATSIESGRKYVYGDALFNSFAWSVPSALISKPKLMVEQFIQTEMGLPVIDDSVSWIAVAYADFGLIGCFIYGVIFALLLHAIPYATKWSKNKFLYCIGSAEACFIAYNIESDPVVTFAAFRNIIILLICFYIYKKFFFRIFLNSSTKVSES